MRQWIMALALVSFMVPVAGAGEIHARIEGPDTDALKGNLRDNSGQGVHFSGPGLREHAARWREKVAPWLEKQ